jgi:hypothetical protein
VWCYTIHGLVSKVAGKICNDDQKLSRVLDQWDANDNADVWDSQGTNTSSGAADTACTPRCDTLHLDLLMLDEAQDLRPSFYKALCHIIKWNHHGPNKSNRDCGTLGLSGLQMCLVGDPKQMLYDFPTFGDDKASDRYMKHPEQYWGRFTNPRTWVTHKLTISYRLTPNIATFVNTIWGTSIKGGNITSGNLQVEYLCRYPYPATIIMRDDKVKLQTSFLSKLIDEHGAENVMFMAQSVKNQNCPIRVHVNALMKEKNTAGRQKYNFHIKESSRGFEGSSDIKNKVRVWTFCGSKGCEADCVVVFGLDMMHLNRIQSLNQVGVALSRAKRRLIVVHGKSYVNGKICDNHYYPMLGDSDVDVEAYVDKGERALTHHVDCNGKQYRYDIPPFPEELEQNAREEIIQCRSKLTQQAMKDLANNAVICLKNNWLPFKFGTILKEVKDIVYLASEFSYFASSEEDLFLSYGAWIKESGVVDRIQYNVDVQFERTKEGVSALYGEALTYMLQWERDGFCPNIETVVNDGILKLDQAQHYKEEDVQNLFRWKKCEPLSSKHANLFLKEFEETGKMLGKDLILFLNTRIQLKKKRVDGDRIIYFRVKAVESTVDDRQMQEFLPQIKSVYESPNKTPSQWMYLANAVMAFEQYHDKWNQIGTDPKSYDNWVESNVLLEALSRLSNLMKDTPVSNSEILIKQEGGVEANQGGEFECEVLYEFPPEHCIKSDNSAMKVIGIQGICDWVGLGLVSKMGNGVDLLEIKFVNELSNVNRLQVLAYCALLSLQTDRCCSGMLYNARTGELEICRIEATIAQDFLLDISQFKHSGTKRQPAQSILKEETIMLPEPNDTSMSSTAARNDLTQKIMYSSAAESTKFSTNIKNMKFVDLTKDSRERKRLRSLEVEPAMLIPARDTAIIDLTMDANDDDDA